MKYKNTVWIFLLVILTLLSLLKDKITPDYLNTPEASFLKSSATPISETIFSHSIFWLLSFLYSASFILLPYFTLRLTSNKSYAILVLYILTALIVSEYIMVFSNIDFLKIHIVPKINRYIHSPIPLLFFIAAQTLIGKTNGNK